MEHKQDERATSILDPKFKYTPAAGTDVQATWRKFGWMPLSEKEMLSKIFKAIGETKE